ALERAAAAAGAAPDGLGGAVVAAVEHEVRATDGRHVLRGGRVFDAVAVVTRRDRDGDAGTIEVAVVRRARLGGDLACAPRVRDQGRVRGRVVLGGEEVGEAVRVRLDQQDPALRTHCVGRVEVERDLESPAGVARRRRGAAGLVDLAEAARVRLARAGRQGRQAEVRAWGLRGA